MKKIDVIIMLILCTFLLHGCADTKGQEEPRTEDISKNEKNPFLSDEEEIEYAYACGVVGFDDIDYAIEYSGEPIQLEYFVDNAGSNMEIGVFLFIDGVLQSVQGTNQTVQDMTLLTVPEKEYVTQKVTFDPSFGTKGESYNVRVAYVLNPNTYANSPNFNFENNTKAMSIFPFLIKISTDIGEKPKAQNIGLVNEIEEAEYSKYVYVDDKGNDINKLRNCVLTVSGNTDDGYSYIEAKDEKVTLDCEIYGGLEADYFVSIIVNNVLVENAGIISVKNGFYKTSVSLDLPLSLLENKKIEMKEYNNIYVMLVPINNNSENMLIKSETFIFQSREEK